MERYVKPVAFGVALEDLRDGKKVYRKGWNGKGMWIALHNPYEEAHENNKMNRPYLYIKSATDTLVPWVASQTDILARDWLVFQEDAGSDKSLGQVAYEAYHKTSAIGRNVKWRELEPSGATQEFFNDLARKVVEHAEAQKAGHYE